MVSYKGNLVSVDGNIGNVTAERHPKAGWLLSLDWVIFRMATQMGLLKSATSVHVSYTTYILVVVFCYKCLLAQATE